MVNLASLDFMFGPVTTKDYRSRYLRDVYSFKLVRLLNTLLEAIFLLASMRSSTPKELRLLMRKPKQKENLTGELAAQCLPISDIMLIVHLCPNYRLNTSIMLPQYILK